MNIMLVAVAERTRELGLRKALGATPRDLFVQLLGETVVITVSAGLLGLALGGGIILVMQVLRNSNEQAQFLMPQVILFSEARMAPRAGNPPMPACAPTPHTFVDWPSTRRHPARCMRQRETPSAFYTARTEATRGSPPAWVV